MAEPARTQAVEDVQNKIQALSTRDLQLWSIGLLVLLVLALGFLALVLPNVVWGSRTLSVAGTYLPQLFFGFIALIVLFNIYVVGQRRELNAARQELVTELMFTQRAHNLSLVDPLTQIFNRRYLDHIVPKEISRADRNAAPLTFVLFDLEGFRDINARQGHKAGDELLVEAARTLQKTFAASETVLRYGGDEFLVVIPDCTEQQAVDMVEQVFTTAKLWNETSRRAYKMAFRYGMASYRSGSDIKEVLRSAEARMESVREKSHEDAARTRPQCLLLCADEAAVQMLQPMLESLEVRTERCADAAEGLHKLACQRFEAMLADCSTEEGMQFAASASALPSRRHMILIALASSSADVARLGANFVLEKPLSAALAASSLRVAQTIMMAERQRYFRHSVSLPVTISFGAGRRTVPPPRTSARAAWPCLPRPYCRPGKAVCCDLYLIISPSTSGPKWPGATARDTRVCSSRRCRRPHAGNSRDGWQNSSANGKVPIRAGGCRGAQRHKNQFEHGVDVALRLRRSQRFVIFI